jgi:hypothetical protein
MSNSKHIIGFASQYYTLWTYRTETIYVTDAYGKHWPSHNYTYYTFHKNISKNLDNVKELYPDVSIDEGLRGQQRSFSVKSEQDLTPELIKFGKYKGYTISEIADMDFYYLLWLRDNCYISETRNLINKLPSIVEYDADLLKKEKEKYESIVNSFLNAGQHTIKFDSNPGECLSDIGVDISFHPNCPSFILERYNQLKYVKMHGGMWVEPLMTVFGEKNGVRYLFVFESYKQVNGYYPYKMVRINGVFTKTKYKEFNLKITPIGFAHIGDESKPFYQILFVV